jgi:hypothetical protein
MGKNKKYTFIIITFLFTFLSAFAQNDTTKVQKEKPRDLRVWRITEDLGTTVPADLDTAIVNFQNTTTDLPYGLANAFNGNLGSPLETKIYFDRKTKSDFLFLKPYSSYFYSIEDYNFFNTKTPYTNLTYYRAGPGRSREERFKANFAINVNPKFNFGFLFDYIYGRGIYAQQSTNHTTGGLFGSYNGKHYEAYFVASLNNFKNYENGGIKDDRYITEPEVVGQYSPQSSIPVNLPPGTTSKLNNKMIFYNHKYHIGKERTNATDSTKSDFIPITTFTHTIKFENNAKGYWDGNTTSFYLETDTLIKDTARLTSLNNTFAISLNEEFARFGLTAFIRHELQRYRFIKDNFIDSTLYSNSENNISIGGILSKHLGKRFKYDVQGEAYVLGHSIGEFDVSANFSTLFPIWKDTLSISTKGFIKSSHPNFFLEEYESMHFNWQYSFNNEYKTHIGGKIAIPTKKFSFGIGVENISNLVYFYLDLSSPQPNMQIANAFPAQHSGSVQVFAMDLKQDFRIGPVYLENKIIYQVSGNQDILPLPELSLYHNLYLKVKLLKLLTMQFGVDLRYNTAYYAPLYIPATGQFHIQDNEYKVKIGNFPLINVYGNFHLKRMRFFLLYSHINQSMSKPIYFSMTGYPLNPGMLKIGLSWNFYD